MIVGSNKYELDEIIYILTNTGIEEKKISAIRYDQISVGPGVREEFSYRFTGETNALVFYIPESRCFKTREDIINFLTEK